MRPFIRSPRRVSTALALLATLAGPPAALAQFRPPPATEAQRMTEQGEQVLVSANAALAKGDKKEAEEKFKKALQLFEQSLAQEPQSVFAAAGLGSAANALQDFQRTATRLAPVFAQNPRDLSLAYPLGTAYFKLRRFQEAVPVLEQVAAADQPDHLIVHYYLASYYLYVQDGNRAVTRLQRYLVLRPEKLAGNDFQIHELLGKAHLIRRDAAAARASFEKAQAGRAESATAQIGLAAVLEMEGKVAESRALLERLVTKFPQVAEPKERLARLYLAAGDVPRADLQATALMKLGSTPAAHLLLGDVRLAQKQPAQAEAEFRKVLELQPGLLMGQIAVGKALQAQARHEEAIQFLESAVKSGGGSLELWATLGSVNRRAGRYQRAVEVHRRVVEMAPRQALGHMLLGADHFATGQWDQAIEDYGSALQAEPGHPGAKQWLARALAHRARDRAGTQRLEDAVRDLRRAYDLDRSVPMARRLGAALLDSHQFAEARKVLEGAVTLPGVSWREHLLLGYARLGGGDPQAALAAFTQSGEATQEPDQRAEASAGAALAEVELGQVDAAVQRLTDAGPSKTAAKVAEANLPRVLVRRALAKLEAGDAAAANRDLDAVDRLGTGKRADLAKLAAFARALTRAEEGRFAEATAGIKRSLTPAPEWAWPNTRALADAWVLYRQGKVAPSRKLLTAAQKKPMPGQPKWMGNLTGALLRREAALAYASGNMKASQKALKAALAATPDDALVQHNLACVDWRQGDSGSALATWKRLETSVPVASLNLGIDAQERRHEPAEAVDAWRRYLASGAGLRAAQVREWKDRLQGLYGLGDAQGVTPAAGVAEETP
ncbi:tetratricopeptide repeat protein [Corallococcus sp. AS-1-12]|uniref:tetratricopeptide repeat protein n=1 Tax=Corallococcus sp. AS-1-12 TaxID=2874598 RepID=UPI001CBC8776|nr:tetratricopeptide repeat protein [Corallococcus sp. AS-1-12]MBZ4332926.1 tetratricopeptide repeat protein [Corallococcus sp. AS-1-12]